MFVNKNPHEALMIKNPLTSKSDMIPVSIIIVIIPNHHGNRMNKPTQIHQKTGTQEMQSYWYTRRWE